MARTKKITAVLPADLLAEARKATGEGVTETLRRGLELLKRQRAYEEFRKLRGTYHFKGFDLDKLREDD